MQLHDLMAKLFELRQVAADQAKDGPSGSGAMARALTAYEWLGDNIEAFVAGLDPEMTEGPASQTEGVGGGAPYCDGAVAHIDIGGLLERHVEELRVHAAKLRWQMENDERPIPPHGWTCFHCAQTFTTWASASAHFGGDPLSGRPTCCASTQEAVERAIREWGEGPCDSLEDLTHAVRAALTPPETAEAVPVAGGDMNACPICKGHSKFDECSCHYAASKTVHLVPETTRLREDLGQVTRELEEEAALRVGAIDRMKDAEQKLADAVKALETAREELRGHIADRLDQEADLMPCSEDASVFHSAARLIRADFSYEDADALASVSARSASSQGGE